MASSDGQKKNSGQWPYARCAPRDATSSADKDTTRSAARYAAPIWKWPICISAQVVGHRRHYGGAAIFSSARPAGGSTRRARGQRPRRRAAHPTAPRRAAHSAPAAAQAGRSGGMAAFRRVHWRTCGCKASMSIRELWGFGFCTYLEWRGAEVSRRRGGGSWASPMAGGQKISDSRQGGDRGLGMSGGGGS